MTVVKFILPHIRVLKSISPVQVLANTDDCNLLNSQGLDIDFDFVPVVRPISPLQDLMALCILYVRFLRTRPSAVHTITPKAGFLGMAASFMARVPLRVHSFTGQVWVTRHGLMRLLLKTIDKLTAAMATYVLVDSPSQHAFLIEQRVVSPSKSTVLGEGSICGVNTILFSPSLISRQAVRKELGSAPETMVCLFLGRLNRDKGVLDLARAFSKVAGGNSKVELWIVGPDESNIFRQMQYLLGTAVSKVKRVGFTLHPERFMQAADLFCLPSYREGFGSSVIEAAACGVPALVSNIYGLTDAVVEGKTGWLHEPGNIGDLARKLDEILANPSELDLRGEAARLHAKSNFAEELITSHMLNFYTHQLSEKNS